MLGVPINDRELDAKVAELVMNRLRYSEDNTRAYFDKSLAMCIFFDGRIPRGVNKVFPDSGWEHGEGTRWFTPAIPRYSSDLAAWGEVNKRITDLGLQEKYLRQLYDIICGAPLDSPIPDMKICIWDDIWCLIEAPQRTKCLAILRVMEDRANEQG